MIWNGQCWTPTSAPRGLGFMTENKTQELEDNTSQLVFNLRIGQPYDSKGREINQQGC